MIKFGIQNAFRRKTTLVIAMIGTGLGVGLMTTLLSLSEGMNRELNQTTNEVAGDITITADDSPFGGPLGGLFGGGSPLPTNYNETLRGIEHVVVVAPRITTTIPTSSFDTPVPFGSSLTGIDVALSSQSDKVAESVTEGRIFENDNEVIAGKDLLLRHNFISDTKVELNSTIDVPLIPKNAQIQPMTQMDGTTPDRLTPDQYPVETLTIVGFYETGSPFTDAAFYTNLRTARTLSQIGDEYVSSYLVRVDDVDYVETVTSQIEETFADAEVPISVSIAKDSLGSLNQALDIFQTFLLVIAVVASVSGGMSILIIMLMNVNERLKEFGILKASGWSNVNIIWSVVVEAITVSFLGAGAGFLTGYGVTRIIDHYLERDIAVISANLIVGVILFGIVMGVIGGLYPALKAARVSPMETIRGE